jgi:hypothetical protein
MSELGESTSSSRESFSERWLLGRELSRLDHWPSKFGDLEDTNKNQTVYRLNWSIKWHTLSCLQAKRWYTGIKTVQITAAAAIPVLAATGGNAFATKGWIAALGALIVILEGIQQLKKYAQNALLWAQGKEALKREYYLYQAKAWPYPVDGDRADKLLADRIEQIIGQEVGKWAEQPHERDNTTTGLNKAAKREGTEADSGGHVFGPER